MEKSHLKLFPIFQVQQHEFRERFRKDAPFRYNSDRPYSLLDRCHEEIKEMEHEMAKLYEAAAIFCVMCIHQQLFYHTCVKVQQNITT